MNRGWLSMLGVLTLASAVLTQAQAQEYAAQVVRCESHESGTTYCAIDAPNGVQLVRQLSERDCIREEGWGVDERGLWTARGCRAEFAPVRAAVSGLQQVRRVVRCESDGRPQNCPVDLQGVPVRLLRQLTALPCREGSTWGVKRKQIWVSRGCRGEFELGAADGSGFPAAPRSVTCESRKQLRRECGITIERSARLSHQLSSSPCELGRSWGWSRDGVWVSAGCRAQFIVD